MSAERTWNQKRLVARIYKMTEAMEDRKYHNPTMAEEIRLTANEFNSYPAEAWGVEFESLRSRVAQLRISATNMTD